MTREPPVMDSGRAHLHDEPLEYLDSFSVVVATAAGSSIERTCKQLVVLAQRLGVMVETEFNGVTVFARPHDDPKQLADRWHRNIVHR